MRTTNGRNERMGASMQLFRVSWQSPKVSPLRLRRNGHVSSTNGRLWAAPGKRLGDRGEKGDARHTVTRNTVQTRAPLRAPGIAAGISRE